ncbi:M50 family metallopeptidase [Paratractidigestivibacter sp.]|uniref:M50 family metallopeptidase n=1 Tax=Paratractidigestivibacter sp. TaxID=2847316 RepID=UPI002AC93F1B|nr:site-2 protease family protein [Paratractidigestivibacter sp.]
MSGALSVLSAVFWGLTVLSLLVFIHEAGHYAAARAFGVRVTEFMLGLPCRWRLSRKSRKVGTEIGVTPILLGGYNRICGMEPYEEKNLANALACVQKHGRIEAKALAEELKISEDEATAALATLCDWASIRPFYNPDLGEKPGQSEWPAAFETQARDACGLTEYDRGHDFSREGATKAGAARPLDGDAGVFLSQERGRTYLGTGFFKRLVMLVAGPLVNILFAFVVVAGAFMVTGVSVASTEPVVGAVTEGSYAQACGLAAGDRIERVGDTEVGSWSTLVAAMKPYLEGGVNFTMLIERDGSEVEVNIDLSDGEATDVLGISSQVSIYHPNLAEAAGLTVRYGQSVASYVIKLIIPQETMEVLNQSTSIVGISVMASQAAQIGVSSLVLLAASISMSLGFMNLLPIPPLDGGKILIEVIQLIIRRQLSFKVQNAISYVGLAFFVFVFVVVLKNDIFRYVIG